MILRLQRPAQAIGLSLALLAATLVATTAARAHDEAKYPDWSGVWNGTGGNKWPTPAPLTSEYQKIFEANLRDQEAGGHGDTPTVGCLPPGMPRQMNVYEPLQIVITPEMVHMLMEHVHDSRRIYTDGRPFPKEMEPMFAGYSIGKWEDTDGDGRLDTLLVETRGLKGPRTYDSTGIPMHKNNQTVVTERLSLDKTSCTTRSPRSTTRSQSRGRSPRPIAATPSRRNRIGGAKRFVPRTIPTSRSATRST
jgi:hypothetical protein